MIGSLRGRLLHRGAGEVHIEVGGVGYLVVVSPTTAVALGNDGDGIVRYAHRAVAGLSFRPTDELVQAVRAASPA